MTTATRNRTGSSVWILGLPYVALGLAYLPTLYDLVVDWSTDPNYSHGFLIPLVSGWLIWTKRKELAEIDRLGSPAGLVVIVAGIVLFVLGTAAAEYFTARLSFVVTLFGLTLYLFGADFIRRTWFAFLFLCFMIPIPYVIYYSVAFPMQLLATKVTVTILNFIGMSVVRQGNIIYLDGGYALEVAEACSGIRSLIALLALGAIFSYAHQKKIGAQLILFTTTIPIALFANVLRVFVTTILAATVSLGVTEEPMHTIMGLSVFVISFVCLLAAGNLVGRLFK